MARTKPRTGPVRPRAVPRAVSARMAARMASTQELEELPGIDVPCETEESLGAERCSETEEESIFPEEEIAADMPEPEQVVTISAKVSRCVPRDMCPLLCVVRCVRVLSHAVDVLLCRSAQLLWRGRLRGGVGERSLAASWVRNNFDSAFLRSVISKHGRFVHIPIGLAQERPAPTEFDDHRDGPKVRSAPGTAVNPTVERPVIFYQQGCADLCVAYGLASAVHHFGDYAAASGIALCAAAALASGDAFRYVRAFVNSEVGGWSEAPLSNHDPLRVRMSEPVLLQLVGSDGAGTHAVATLGDLIFDSTEGRALPLTRASLDRCVGAHLNGASFSHTARAALIVPGSSVRKWLRRQQHQQRRPGSEKM